MVKSIAIMLITSSVLLANGSKAHETEDVEAVRFIIKQLTIEFNDSTSEARKQAILRDVKRLRKSLASSERG